MMATEHADPLLQEVNTFVSKPRDLRDLCRLSVRAHLSNVARGSGISRLVNHLPLPLSLMRYLKYDWEVTNEWEDDDEDVDITLSFREL